jgi:hypothetical protein
MIASQDTTNRPPDPTAPQTPLTSVYTNALPAILDHFGISLAAGRRRRAPLRRD